MSRYRSPTHKNIIFYFEIHNFFFKIIILIQKKLFISLLNSRLQIFLFGLRILVCIFVMSDIH